MANIQARTGGHELSEKGRVRTICRRGGTQTSVIRYARRKATLYLAEISTAVLEGGNGPPVIFLHGPSGYAAHWMHVIPDLVSSYRVTTRDLPGHCATGTSDEPLEMIRRLRRGDHE